MTSNIQQLIQEARGDYDPKLLTETGAGGLLSSGYLATNPIIEYLEPNEVPHFTLHSDDQAPVVDCVDAASPPDPGKFRGFVVLTDKRILILVGSSQGDYKHTIPYWEIETVSIKSDSGLFSTNTRFSLTTHRGGTLQIEELENDDVARAEEFVKERATRHKCEFCEGKLSKVSPAKDTTDLGQYESYLRDALAILSPAVEWEKNEEIIDTQPCVRKTHERIETAQNLIDDLQGAIRKVSEADTTFQQSGFRTVRSTYETVLENLECNLEIAAETDLPLTEFIDSYIAEVRRRIDPHLPTSAHDTLEDALEEFRNARLAASESDDLAERERHLQTALSAAQEYLNQLTAADYNKIDTRADGCAICNRSPAIFCETNLDAERVKTCWACVPFGDGSDLLREPEIRDEIRELEQQLGKALAESNTVEYVGGEWNGIDKNGSTRVDLIAAVYWWADEFDRPPAYAELDKYVPMGMTPLQPYYDTLEGLGLDLEEVLLDEFRRHGSESDLALPTQKIIQESPFPKYIFNDTFTSLDRARKEAGLRNIADYEWIHHIREYYRIHDEAPTPSEVADESGTDLETVFDDVSEWQEALTAAGIPESEFSLQTEIENEIEQIADSIGHRPSPDELEYYSDYPRATLEEFCPDNDTLIEFINNTVPKADETLVPNGPLDEAPDESTVIPSHTDLLRELFWLLNRHGEQKIRSDLAQLSTFDIKHYHVQFGSVENALDRVTASQDTKGPQSEYAPKRLLTDELRELGQYLNRGPKLFELVMLGNVSIEKYAQKFKSMAAIHKTAGYEWEPEIPSNEDLLDDLERVAADKPHPPQLETYAREGQYDYAHLIRRFDDWFGALQAAGLSPLTEGYPVLDYRTKEVDRVRFENRLRLKTGLGLRPVLLDELYRLSHELSAAPTADAVDALSQYPLETFTANFESFDAAVEDANLTDLESVAPVTVAHFRQDIQFALEGFVDQASTPPLEHAVSGEMMYSPLSYIIVFGSFDEALKSVGYSPDDLPPATDIEFLDAFSRTVDTLDRTPLPYQLGAHSPFSSAEFAAAFGGLEGIYDAAGVAVPPEMSDSPQDDTSSQTVETDTAEVDTEDEQSTAETESPTKDELITELQRLNNATDRPLKSTDVRDESPYTPHKYYSEFGSWDEALEAAGIDRGEQCLDELGSVVDELGRFPNQGEFTKNASLSSGVVLEHFDDWVAVLESYSNREGIADEGARDNLLVGEIQRLSNRQADLVMPSDISEDSVFTPKDLIDRFDSWQGALSAAGFDVESRLLDSIRRLQRDLERQVTATDLEESDRFETAVLEEVFGSVDEAVEAYLKSTGRSASSSSSGGTGKGTQFTTEDDDDSETVLDAIKRVATELNHPIRPTDLEERSKFNRTAHLSEFGDWNEAVEAAGINREQNLLDEIHDVAQEVGHIPSQNEFNDHSAVSFGMLTRYFGYWSDATEEYERRYGEPEESEQASKSPPDSKNKDDSHSDSETLLEAIERVASGLDHPIRTTDLKQNSAYGRTAHQADFDSWDEAVEAAGINREQNLLEEIHYVAQEIGHVPSQSEFDNHSEISFGIVVQYFDYWSDAIGEYERRYRGPESSEQSNRSSADNGKTSDADASKKKAFQAFHRIAKQLGHPPSYKEFDKMAEYRGGYLTGQIGTWEKVKDAYRHWASKTARNPVTEKQDSTQGASATRTESDVEANTILAEVPEDKRIRTELPIKVVDVESSRKDRVDQELQVRDADGTSAQMKIWEKHDINSDWVSGECYEISQFRVKRWEKNWSDQINISSTRDLEIEPLEKTQLAVPDSVGTGDVTEEGDDPGEGTSGTDAERTNGSMSSQVKDQKSGQSDIGNSLRKKRLFGDDNRP